MGQIAKSVSNGWISNKFQSGRWLWEQLTLSGLVAQIRLLEVPDTTIALMEAMVPKMCLIWILNSESGNACTLHSTLPRF